MRKIKRAVMLLFLLILILLQSSSALYNGQDSGNINEFLKLYDKFETNSIFLKLEFHFIRQEIGFLRQENSNQNMEIAQLKKMMESKGNPVLNTEKIKKLIDQSIEKYLAVDHEQDDPLRAISRLGKRPARLLPHSILHGKKPKNQTIPQPFFGPATNCSELSKLGYTLNGFYLVKPKVSPTANTTGDIITNLDTVYCSFKQPEGTVNQSINLEKRINVVSQLKTMEAGSKSHRGIYFYAIKNMTRPSLQYLTMLDIRFDHILLNSGFKFKSGFVTVPIPKSGVYQFVYTAVMNTTDRAVSNVLLANGNRNIAQSRSLNSGNLMVQAILKANLGDNIYVRSDIGNGASIQWASFSGTLLEEL